MTSPVALDRWYRLLETTVRLRCANADIGRVADRLFASFRIDEPPSGGGELVEIVERDPGVFDVLRNGEAYRAGIPADRALSRLLNLLNKISVQGLTVPVFHAGVVARRGAVIAFPGSSGSGKSTLTAACALAGFEYVSDEVLCLDPATRTVTPFPKPLWLSPWSRETLGIDSLDPTINRSTHKSGVTPDDLGVTVAEPPLVIEHVVLTEGAKDVTADLEPAAPSAAVLTLLRNRFLRSRVPAEAFRQAAEIARESQAWRLVYRDPTSAAKVLSERFE